jgi:hypothetical protein
LFSHQPDRFGFLARHDFFAIHVTSQFFECRFGAALWDVRDKSVAQPVPPSDNFDSVITDLFRLSNFDLWAIFDLDHNLSYGLQNRERYG